MHIDLHPGARIRKLTVGNRAQPVLVVDDFVDSPERLIDAASRLEFAKTTRYFPGVRAEAPEAYRRLFDGRLGRLIADCFGERVAPIEFSMCHFSLVTTPPEELLLPQRIPHTDSFDRHGLATIHYLFRGDFGGTAFYRHRSTGLEHVDHARSHHYLEVLKRDMDSHGVPEPCYINGDTALFEQIAAVEGRFNRLLVYRRNVLHSGSIHAGFVPDDNPLTGRLSINSFIDFRRPAARG